MDLKKHYKIILAVGSLLGVMLMIGIGVFVFHIDYFLLGGQGTLPVFQNGTNTTQLLNEDQCFDKGGVILNGRCYIK